MMEYYDGGRWKRRFIVLLTIIATTVGDSSGFGFVFEFGHRQAKRPF